MKREETVAEQFLRSLNKGVPVFEPDGNRPPDFVLDHGRIAVEVRRLNYMVVVDGEPQGTEELNIPLWRWLRKFLSDFDQDYDGTTYLVYVSYHHRFQKLTREMKREIKRAFREFLNGPRSLPHEFQIRPLLTFHLTSGKPVEGKPFLLISAMNFDEAGGLIQQYQDNVSFCIQEKAEKIAPFFDRYPEWWLLLVDSLQWGALREFEIEAIHKRLQISPFSKVVVIDYQANLVMAV